MDHETKKSPASRRLPLAALSLAIAAVGFGAERQGSSSPVPDAPLPPGPVVATIGGALPPPLPLFPPTNWWNLDVTNAPVDPSSANFINFIGASQPLHPDFGGEVSPGSVQIYGFPYIITDSSEPRLAVNFVYSDQSDGVNHNSNQSFPFYPIPPESITQPHWIEEGDPGDVDLRSSNDRHMLIVDATHNFLYELYNVFYDGTTWQAGSGAFFDMNTNHRRPDTWTSADAAGLAMLPGLVRYDEVYQMSDPIKHAFRMTSRDSNGYVYPASHAAGTNPSALPMGARLRLKASVDISGFDPYVQRIFQAMKTYGLIMADNGSDMYISGTFDTRWNNDILNPAFGSLSAGDFDVVQLGYCNHPTAVAAGSATVCSGASAVLSGSGGTSCSWSPPATGLSDSNSCSPTASPTSTTTYTLTVADDAGCASVNVPTVTVTVAGTGAPAVPVVSAPASVAPSASAVTASVSNPTANLYTWSVSGGTITSGQGTAQITFDAGSAGTTVHLEVVETAAAGCDSSPGLANTQADFLDVPPSNPFHDFVDTIARDGVTAGCGAGDFCPASSVLRAQMAVFLLRGEHGAAFVPPPAVGNFADVLETNPFAPWIEQLNNEGITAGCDAIDFCPDDPVTRSSMAVFLLLAEHGSSYVPPACTGIFTDVACPGPFTDWIERLYNEGITGGCNANPPQYCPGDPVTRAQMAVFLTTTFSLP